VKNNLPGKKMEGEEESSHFKQRRDFLTRSGIVGAVAAISPMLLASNKTQAGWISNSVIKQVLDAVTLDTFKGVTAFVMPGNDWHSITQGEATWGVGGLAANTDQYLLENLDNYLPWPKDIGNSILSALGGALSESAGSIPTSLAILLKPVEVIILNALDKKLDALIGDSEVIPLGHVFSLILNITATIVNPLTINGGHISPFSRLTMSEKAQVFQRLETGQPSISDLIGGKLSAQENAFLPDLMATFIRSLLQLATFGSMSEWHALDKNTKTLNQIPIGWQLSNYLPNGPVEGHDDLLGYWQDRSEIDV